MSWEGGCPGRRNLRYVARSAIRIVPRAVEAARARPVAAWEKSRLAVRASRHVCCLQSAHGGAAREGKRRSPPIATRTSLRRRARLTTERMLYVGGLEKYRP